MQEHRCITDPPCTVENRDGDWYLYSGDERGAMPIRFCPYCGKDLWKLSRSSTIGGEGE